MKKRLSCGWLGLGSQTRLLQLSKDSAQPVLLKTAQVPHRCCAAQKGFHTSLSDPVAARTWERSTKMERAGSWANQRTPWPATLRAWLLPTLAHLAQPCPPAMHPTHPTCQRQDQRLAQICPQMGC